MFFFKFTYTYIYTLAEIAAIDLGLEKAFINIILINESYCFDIIECFGAEYPQAIKMIHTHTHTYAHTHTHTHIHTHTHTHTHTHIYIYIYIYIYISKSKVSDRSRGRPEDSIFNSYYTDV